MLLKNVFKSLLLVIYSPKLIQIVPISNNPVKDRIHKMAGENAQNSYM